MAERFEIVEKALLKMLEEKKYAALRDILLVMNPSDIAELFQQVCPGRTSGKGVSLAITNRTQLALTCCTSFTSKSTRTFFISKMLDIIYNVFLNVYLCEDSIILFHTQANKKNVGMLQHFNGYPILSGTRVSYVPSL